MRWDLYIILGIRTLTNKCAICMDLIVQVASVRFQIEAENVSLLM